MNDRPIKNGMTGTFKEAEMSTPVTRKVFCPTCGDVTDGHPEEDAVLRSVYENAFTVSYTKDKTPDV